MEQTNYSYMLAQLRNSNLIRIYFSVIAVAICFLRIEVALAESAQATSKQRYGS
jgi:hypothetical protein